MLIDSGSSVDVLCRSTYNHMGLPLKVLKPTNTSLYGYTSCSTQPLSRVKLSITANNHPTQATIFINFLVVDMSSIYNIIIGRPTLNILQAVALTYHLAMKFPTVARIGVVCGRSAKLLYPDFKGKRE